MKSAFLFPRLFSSLITPSRSQSSSKQLSRTDVPPPTSSVWLGNTFTWACIFYPVSIKEWRVSKQIGCLLRSISVLMWSPDLKAGTRRGGKTIYILSPFLTRCGKHLSAAPPQHPQTGDYLRRNVSWVICEFHSALSVKEIGKRVEVSRDISAGQGRLHTFSQALRMSALYWHQEETNTRGSFLWLAQGWQPWNDKESWRKKYWFIRLH